MLNCMLIISLLFVAGGIVMIVSGNSAGWGVTVFFGLCALVFILEPLFPKPRVSSDYRLLIGEDEIACEHPKRNRESVRWHEIKRIWFVTTPDGPWLPDQWLLFEGKLGGCSFPTEAEGFDALWSELEKRFPGFDYNPMMQGGTDDARHLCWEKPGIHGN
jgi:hypothetical protein